MEPDFTFALAFALALTLVQVAALLLLDANEKEPVWALLLLIWGGAVAAAAVTLVLAPKSRGGAVDIALASQLAKFVAVALGIGILAGLDRIRGWPELNGTVDGLIYGAAAGFGYATGDAFLRETFASVREMQTPDQTTLPELLWMTIQSALPEAMLGAVMGMGLMAAVLGPGMVRRVVGPVLGLAAAVGLRAAYGAIALDHAQVTPSISVLAVMGVLLVVGLAYLVFRRTLRNEVTTIEAELAGEPPVIATQAERELLRNPLARIRRQGALLVAGDVEQLLAERSLQNRQVQLALAKALAGGPEGAAQRNRLERRIAQLKSEIRTERAEADDWNTGAEGPRGDRGAEATPEDRPFRARVTALGVSGAILVGGGLVIAAAGGAEPPTTTATRSALFERQQAEVDEELEPRDVRYAIGGWRLESVRDISEVIGNGSISPLEATDVIYRNDSGSVLTYSIARFESGRQALDVAETLQAQEEFKRRVWVSGERVLALSGSRLDVLDLCLQLEGCAESNVGESGETSELAL